MLGKFTIGSRTIGSGEDAVSGFLVYLVSNINRTDGMKKNVASQVIGSQMITISDGSPFTSTVTVDVTVDGGTQASGGGTVTHEGGGFHSYAPTQAETNGDHIAFTFSGTGAISTTIQTFTDFPQTVDNDTKISAIPTTAMRGTDSALLASSAPTNFSSMVISGAGVASADAVAISGDSVAADNLELMYDGTGYVDDTAPASRSQVDNISVTGGGAVNFNPDGDNVSGAIKGITFVGVQTSGTFTDTFTLNNIFHQIDDTGNTIDIVYSIDITAVNIATGFIFDGFLNSANDTMTIQAFDFVGTAFEQIETINGQGGSGNIEVSAPLLARHTGTTGADIGKVFIRIQNTGQSNPTLFTDRLIVQAVSNLTSLGFEEGAVWLNTVSGTSGTGAGIGFVDNPSDNLTDTLAIAVANNLAKIEVLAGSTDTFPSAMDNITMDGRGYTMAMNGQSCANARFNSGTFSGVCTGSPPPLFTGCLINSSTLPTFTVARECTINGTYTMGEAGTFIFFECNQGGATGPIIDFGAFGASTARLIKWGGEIEFQNMATGDVVVLTGDGKFTVNANCTGGTIRVYGIFDVVDNAGGAVTFEEIARLDLDAINATVDTAISDASLATAANLAAVKVDTAAILVDTDVTLPALIAALNDITGADVLAAGDIDGFSLEESQKIALAALGGKLAGAATPTNTMRAADDSKDRITATVDADGNRTAVTLDGTG